MNLPWEADIAGAASVPVRVAGDWTAGGLRPGAICTWRGTVEAAEEIAAALVVEHFGAIGWSRTRRVRPTGIDLTITVYLPDRPDFRPWVALEAGQASLLWQAPWPGGSGLDVSASVEGQTGRLLSLATTSGREDAARFGLLLLARRDVRFGRKRIWRAHAGIGAGSAALELVLRGPRWGWDPSSS